MMEWLQDAHSWVALSFIIFCLIAWKLGRKPVTDRLDSRIAGIRREIETANALRQEAQSLLDQYRLQQQQAEAEARSIVEAARRSAENIRVEAEKQHQAETARREKQLQDRLNRMEENAASEIRAYAADLAVKATAEIIAAHMDENLNARLVDQSIAELGEKAA